MRQFTLPTLLCCCAVAASASAAEVQIFAANTAAKKKDPIVEIQPVVPSVSTPEQAVAAVPQVTRANARQVTRANALAPAHVRATAVALPARNATTTTFAAVTPVSSSTKQFIYKDPAGQVNAAEVVRGYQPTQIESPIAKIDPKIDPKLRRAATIAQERARASTRRRCWRYVKEALLASGAIDSYPKTVNAKEAGDELVRSYGFKRLPIRDPYAAPVGSVLVYYKGRNRPGHVELRTKDGFASDFRSKTPDKHALLGVYAKRG